LTTAAVVAAVAVVAVGVAAALEILPRLRNACTSTCRGYFGFGAFTPLSARSLFHYEKQAERDALL